jgi:transposase
MENQKLFIGLDIHKNSWAVDMRTDLFHHKYFTQKPEPVVLEKYVDSHFQNHQIHLCYEAGCCGFSAARYFLNLGWEVTVVNPADIPTTDKHNYQKTDKIDAKNLSKQLSDKNLKAIHIPSEQEDFIRCLIRQRNSIVKQKRVVKNRIKSFLLFMGTKIPEEFDNPNWTKGFLAWLSEQYQSDEMGKLTIESQLKILGVLHQEYLDIANKLRSYYRQKEKELYYLLKSVPGIGGYLASVLLTELGDFSRFQNEQHLSSYVGLVPGKHKSGDSEKKLGVTPRCNALLRSYLIEAAWVAVRIDPEMQAYFRRHQGKNEKVVIVKIAHKLIKKIFAVVKRKQPYQVNVSAAEAA